MLLCLNPLDASIDFSNCCFQLCSVAWPQWWQSDLTHSWTLPRRTSSSGSTSSCGSLAEYHRIPLQLLYYQHFAVLLWISGVFATWCIISVVLQSWTKVLGHFCVSEAFSNSHRFNPSPHPTKNVGRVYPELVSEFQLFIGWGRDNCKKISITLHCFKRNQEITEKYEYCSTVPRTFVQDCRFRSFNLLMFIVYLQIYQNSPLIPTVSSHFLS